MLKCICFAQTHFLKICVVTSVTYPGVEGAWVWGEEIAWTPRSCLRFQLGLHTPSKLQICKDLELDRPAFALRVGAVWRQSAPPSCELDSGGRWEHLQQQHKDTCSLHPGLLIPGDANRQEGAGSLDFHPLLKPVKPALKCHSDLKTQATLQAFYNSLTFSPNMTH